MTAFEAFMDDFGKLRVKVSKTFYNGQTTGFYITGSDGTFSDCVLRSVEEHSQEIYYDLIIPANMNFGVQYYLHEAHGRACPIAVRYIVRTAEFDRLFTYDGDDLGPVYHEMYTDFALWAPTACRVHIRIRDARNRISVHTMDRYERGVWRCRVSGDLKKCTYVYMIERDGIVIESTDPYALSSTSNGRESAVIDTSVILKIKDPGVETDYKTAADAVIYECSVRDMTSSRQTGTSTNGKFVSLTETGTGWKMKPTGLDYLVSLGITHVQIQPVNDFSTIDEDHPEKNYNWGYDPLQLLSLEGSYSTNAADPYARMTEFRKMVCALHKKGIRVNTDMVFNHMYDVPSTSLDRTVPYYYFRYNENGYMSNGSFCGNDLDSLRPMMKKLFMKVIRTWMELYGVDGFRFDLMGIIDIDTMNEIASLAASIKPYAMIYGEGWDMPTNLEQNMKSTIGNQHRLPGIGHFNDSFRDVAKGRTGDDQKWEKGYLTGNLSMAFDMCGVLSGNTKGDPYFRRFDSPVQSINAIETHDNATAWDKMHACCAEENRDTRKKRQKMLMAVTMAAQGVPFIHAGMEFCGTKQDNSNSYNAGDVINCMNWDRMILNYDVLEYSRKCIAMRRKWAAFRLPNSSEVDRRVSFQVAEGTIIYYDINYRDEANNSDCVRVIINPSVNDKYYHFPGNWRIILDEQGQEHDKEMEDVFIPAVSVIVLSGRN